MPNLNYSTLAAFSSDYNQVMMEAIRRNNNNPLTDSERSNLFNAFQRYHQTTTTSTSTSSSTTSSSPPSSGKSNVFEGIAKIATGYVATQQQQDYMPQMNEEYIKMNDIIGTIINKQGQLNSLQDIGKNVLESAVGQIELYLKQQTALRQVINRDAGVTGLMAEDFREELTKANPELLRMGIGFNELANAGKQLVDQTGRFAFINAQTWKAAGTAATAFVGSLGEMIAMLPGFESIGLGARDAINSVDKVGKKSIELGLQAQKTTKELSNNIGKLNEYGFKNGIEGLGKMIMKANEFRMSMDSVFKIADKVMSPEGAIDLAANLQVLGGAIGDFNDPLKMMYMATNNVEGLQDALIGAAGGLATYNSEQGRFEITGANLRRAKEMADQFGMSLGDLSKLSIATAERASAAADLMSNGLDLKDDQKEFITNIAQMKDGKMTIELNSDRLQNIFGKQEIALDQLTQAQVNQLMEYQDDFKKKTPEEIIRDQATAVMNIERDVNFMVALLRQQGGKAADKLYNEYVKGTGFDLNQKAQQTRNIADANAPEMKKLGDQVVDMVKGGVNNAKKLLGTSSVPNNTNPNTQQGVVAQPTTTPAPNINPTPTPTPLPQPASGFPANSLFNGFSKVDVRVGLSGDAMGLLVPQNKGSYLVNDLNNTGYS